MMEILAIFIYIAYNTAVLTLFGIPKSLSETFYLFKNKKEWTKILFPTMMLSMVCCLLPYLLNLTEGTNFQFLAFLSLLGISFTGCAPAFRSSYLEDRIHNISAILATIFSVILLILINMWWVLIIWLIICLILSLITKTFNKSKIYWIENIVILSIFTIKFL